MGPIHSLEVLGASHWTGSDAGLEAWGWLGDVNLLVARVSA